MSKTTISVALALLVSSQVFASDGATLSEWEKSQTESMVAVHGTYRNIQYGFGIPATSAHMYQMAPPSPNHGVAIILGDHREIWISGTYDAAEYGSTKAALDNWLQNEHRDSIKRMPATLVGLPAEQVVLRTGSVITNVLLQRREDQHDGVIYELTLTTTQKHQAEDTASFDRICRSFKRYPF